MTEQHWKWLQVGLLTAAGLTAVYLTYDNLTHYQNSADETRTQPAMPSIAVLKQAADQDTLNVNAQFQVGRALLEQQNLTEAVRYYARVEAKTDLTVDELAEIGTVYWMQKPSPKAVSFFVKALRKDSVHPGALFGFGQALLQIGDTRGARLRMEKIVRHHPDDRLAAVAQTWIDRIKQIENQQTREKGDANAVRKETQTP